ncbi:hypothetical protein QR680_008836 [Steinernema hermaphroditum]|uniref:RRM domain-containing protein n=1 Tax=Steinernema hermaphroditum TaxID=289476 RepID=A0AA39II35_9BILA|nr:hypothetical protein QR680_008836 [Steinernema hermaphroditum]
MSRLIIKGLPGSITEDKLRRHFADHGATTDCQLRYTGDGIFQHFVFVGFHTEEDAQKVANPFNNTFIGTTRITLSFATGSQSERSTSEEDGSFLDTGRLFVRNLPYTGPIDDLLFLFKPLSEISECKKTGKGKGFAVVTFVFPENPAAAYAALDGSVFNGRMLHLLPGDEKRDNKAFNPLNQKGLSAFQKEKQAKLKANAGKSHSWNALFLGANAVADTLANKLAVNKADTDVDESSASVRLALAETRLVRETREFLLQHGVKMHFPVRLPRDPIPGEKALKKKKECLDAIERKAAELADD